MFRHILARGGNKLPTKSLVKTDMHIELNCNSLAECYARALELIRLSDLGHKSKVTIDIDTESPWDGSYLRVPDYSEKIKLNQD